MTTGYVLSTENALLTKISRVYLSSSSKINQNKPASGIADRMYDLPHPVSNTSGLTLSQLHVRKYQPEILVHYVFVATEDATAVRNCLTTLPCVPQYINFAAAP